MKSQVLCLVVLVSSAFAWANGLSAEDFSTTDDRAYIMNVSPVGGGEEVAANEVPDGAVPASARGPVILNFDRLPPPNLWESYRCFGGPEPRVSHGILTIRSRFAFCNEFFLSHFNNTWHRYVDFRRGWVIEASLRVDPLTQPECSDRASVQIWAHDHTKLVIIGFSTNEICIAYPDNVRFPIDTTDGFHVYRIETKGLRVKIYVDGGLKIDHRLSWKGGGTDVLSFGDGTVSSTSRSRWDYFSYDIFP